jgi:predicted phosphodiesterase
MTLIVGDIHGKVPQLLNLVKMQGEAETIQIGDLGMGFQPMHLIQEQFMPPNTRFIRGNHDNPAVCRAQTSFIEDGTIEGNRMFIGGAWSIDHMWRTPGVSWWHDEECSIEQLEGFVDKAVREKPEVMITHDGPQEIIPEIFNDVILHKDKLPTRTGQAFDRIRQLVQPKLWIFGHWHIDRRMFIDKCEYVCLAELSGRHVDFDTLHVGELV